MIASMGWTEGVLIVALVVIRLYSLGLDQVRARIIAGRSDSDDRRTVNARWTQYLIAASVGAALLLAMASLLAAADAGRFGAGVRVGVVLWISEVLVHAPSALAMLRQLRAGAPVTIEAAMSQPVVAWTSTALSVPFGALIGSLLAR
jgi:hypothetical protein